MESFSRAAVPIMQEDQLIVAEKWCAVHLDHIHCFCLEGNLDHYIQHNNLIFTVDCVDTMDGLFLIFGFCCALCVGMVDDLFLIFGFCCRCATIHCDGTRTAFHR